jgi:hypothetical protein
VIEDQILLNQPPAAGVPVISIKRKKTLRPFFAIMRSNQRML